MASLNDVSHMSEDRANDELVSDSGDSSEGSSGSEEDEEVSRNRSPKVLVYVIPVETSVWENLKNR